MRGLQRLVDCDDCEGFLLLAAIPCKIGLQRRLPFRTRTVAAERMDVEELQLLAPLVGEILIGDRDDQHHAVIGLERLRGSVDRGDRLARACREFENSIIAVLAPRPQRVELVGPHRKGLLVDCGWDPRFDLGPLELPLEKGPDPLTLLVRIGLIGKIGRNEIQALGNGIGKSADNGRTAGLSRPEPGKARAMMSYIFILSGVPRPEHRDLLRIEPGVERAHGFVHRSAERKEIAKPVFNNADLRMKQALRADCDLHFEPTGGEQPGKEPDPIFEERAAVLSYNIFETRQLPFAPRVRRTFLDRLEILRGYKLPENQLGFAAARDDPRHRGRSIQQHTE